MSEPPRQVSNCPRSLASSNHRELLAFQFWLVVAMGLVALILWIRAPRDALLLLGGWDTVRRKCYQDDCSCPSRTACHIVVVACLPSKHVSDNRSEEWYQKRGFAALGRVVPHRDLRSRPEQRTAMSISAGGKQ